jgi:hypothetical protein
MKMFALIPLALILASGCATAPGRPDTLPMIAQLAGQTLRTGVAFDLQRHAENRPAYELALQTLNALLQSQDYDPVQFHAAFSKVTSNFSGEGGYIELATLAFVNLAGTAFVPDSPEAVKLFMEQFRLGLSQALGGPATKGAPAERKAIVKRVTI